MTTAHALREAFEHLLHDCLAHPLQGVCYFLAVALARPILFELGDAFHDTIGKPAQPLD